MVIPAVYDWANPFSEGLAPVHLNSKWGYIDTKDTQYWEDGQNEGRISAATPYRCGALTALVTGFLSTTLVESTCWRRIA
jgi:hypothetical protein